MSQPKVRVADFIADTFAQNGIRDVFIVTGGGAMHLNDAFGRQKSLTTIPCLLILTTIPPFRPEFLTSIPPLA